MTGCFQVFGVCALMFAVQVSGLRLSFSQNDVILGSTGTLTLTCNVNEQDVDTIYNIQIRRETSSVSPPDSELLASMDIKNPSPTVNPDLNNDKGFDAGGNIDTDNPSNTMLTLGLDIQKLACNDAREYICTMTYVKSGGGLDTFTVRANGTFSTFEYPSVSPLQGKRNEEFIEGSMASSPAPFEVGDQLHLTCTANIGSYEGTLIKWRKTSEIGIQDDFIGYQPQQGSFTNGEATMVSGSCSYMRTATITYNTTTADANRDNHLAFECFVSVSGGAYGGGYTSNNPRFYVDVSGGQAPDQGGVASAGSGNVGAIAGGVVGGLVFIVIIVLLVYFLWYRRRNSGEDYTTKEEYGSENPNIAPPDNTYSYPDKSRTRRGHENKGLDEPHESHKKRHHYENGPGKSNHGMDRSADDYDSRDGSPTMDRSINHMGGDGGFGTGV